MALTSANKVITSALKTFQPVAIPSASMAITSASYKVAIPSATTKNLSAVTYGAVSSVALDKNISPFKCGNSIHHYGNNISQFILWL